MARVSFGGGPTNLQPVLDAIADLKSDVSGLKKDVVALKEDMAEFRIDTNTRMDRLEGEMKQNGILLRSVAHVVLPEDLMASTLSDRDLEEEIARKDAEDKRKKAREGRPREGPFSLSDLSP